MGIIIGSARADENYKYNNGRRGDQRQKSSYDTTGEVSMQDFYVHKLGWYILRPRSKTIAKGLAKSMEDACNNEHIGYSQNDRYSILNSRYKNKLIGKGVNCDCSSLVRKCIIDAANRDVGDFSTVNEADVLEKSGLFEKRKTYKPGVKLYSGDVLVTTSKGHTVIVVSGEERKGNDDETPSSGSNSKTYTIGKKYTVNSEAYMRKEPSSNSSVVVKLSRGEKITCRQVKHVSNSVWVSNGAGWICAVSSSGKVYLE